MRAALALLLVGCGALGACGAAPGRPAPDPVVADWERLHELVDLFDTARVAQDAAARARLLERLGVERDTDKVLDALLVAADHVLERDRLHAGAQAARTLLDYDRHPPADRAALFARMAALKSVARGNGPLAANALLRLALFCAGAFRDAVGMVARDRPLVLASCLYPLHDSDPAPYFDPDPARRPPPPAWADLDAGLRALLAQLGRTASRIAPLAARVADEQQRLVADAAPKGLLPRAFDPQALRVPLVGAAPPYDWEPLIFVAEPTPDELARFERELQGLLAADGRGRVALLLTADAPASAFLAVAGLSRRLGAATVELAVGYRQSFRAPPGDYAGGTGSALRLGVLPLAAPDPARAGLGLTLVVGPRRWQIVSPSGSLPPEPPDSPAARAQLDQVFDAFPDEAALLVAPEPNATVGAIAAAIESARARAGAVGLAETTPAARPGDLAARAARRAAARVTIVPDALADKAPAVRRCYQDALDRTPELAGTLAFEAGAAGLKVVSGPRDEALRRCVAARLAADAAAARVPALRVELRRL
jgi:hypothetical protein